MEMSFEIWILVSGITFLHKVSIFSLSLKTAQRNIQPCSRPGISFYRRPRVVRGYIGIGNPWSCICYAKLPRTVANVVAHTGCCFSEFLGNWLRNTAQGGSSRILIFPPQRLPADHIANKIYRSLPRKSLSGPCGGVE